MKTLELDPVWEQGIYSQGHHLNRYPFDAVVSFMYRWRPRGKPVAATDVLEVGCGAGNNLWFAAREGFRVAGIDGSSSAIAFAQRRLAGEGLAGDLRVGNFLELPWADGSFDLAIDRCSLTCVSPLAQRQAVEEVRRVLRLGGRFFFNCYSDRHASAVSGKRQSDGRVTDITGGTLVGVGGLTFVSQGDLSHLFGAGWQIEAAEHVTSIDETNPARGAHTEWRVVARKT